MPADAGDAPGRLVLVVIGRVRMLVDGRVGLQCKFDLTNSLFARLIDCLVLDHPPVPVPLEQDSGAPARYRDS